MIQLQKIASLLLVLSSVAAVHAAEPKLELLWPDGAPGAKGTADNDKPKLHVFVPEKQSSPAAVIVFPGGGYAHLAMGHEGAQVAEWLNSLGITAFILDYRHSGKGYSHPTPLEDAQRAVRWVRSNAAKFNIGPKKVGVMGFSAGGHLASTVGTHFDSGKPDASDPIDRESCRPDFLILCYPVVTFADPHTHKGSRKNLLGDNPKPKLIEHYSNDKHVTGETPPTFLFHTNADKSVVPENSILFYLALRKANVPAELHIYQDGKHGVGISPDQPVLNNWKDRLKDWLQIRGLLDTK